MSERRPQTETELVELMRSIDVRAPQSLHESVHALLDEHASRQSRRGSLRGAFAASVPRRRLAAAGALAAAALALALALTLGGSATHAPSLRQTAALTLMPATASAPQESTSNRAALSAAVDGLSFPYWEKHLGWRSTGARIDRVAGRTVTTVFYTNGKGHHVGYAIVSGLPAPELPPGATVRRNGIPYRVVNVNGVPVITWLRSGRLCVVSGRGVDAATLLRLASWAPHATPA